MLKEHQAGIAVVDLSRKHGIGGATFYNWRNCYGGLEVSAACRLRTLDDKNRKRKKLLAELKLVVGDLAWLTEVANVCFLASSNVGKWRR